MRTEAQRRAEHDKQRGTPKQRGYDADWRKLRAVYLATHQRCEFKLPSGQQCTAKATQVDHKLSVEARPDLRLHWQNLRAGCASCHSRRTAVDQGFANPDRRHY
jgi:5-methylcytosine-specific restriction protein A